MINEMLSDAEVFDMKGRAGTGGAGCMKRKNLCKGVCLLQVTY